MKEVRSDAELRGEAYQAAVTRDGEKNLETELRDGQCTVRSRNK